MIEWLPKQIRTQEDVEIGRPIRPDLPWLRNLSFTKIHAMQLGFGITLLAYLGIALGFEGAAVALLYLSARRIMSHRDVKDVNSACEHKMGFHDLKQKPWYGLSMGILTVLVLIGVFGMPVDVEYGLFVNYRRRLTN